MHKRQSDLSVGEAVAADNKMADKPVLPLLLSMALPLMLSMMVQALYNIVDSVFIGMLPERAEALQALGYAYPIQMLLVAMGIGTGIGVSALLSRALGQKDGKTASLSAGNGYFLMFCFYAVFLVFGILVLTRGVYFDVCTQNEQVAGLGRIYLGICLVCSFGQFIQLISERCLCSTGKTNLGMIMQIGGAITNIALDPLFIFVFDMGVAGAAVATVLGQCVSMILGLWLNVTRNKEISITPANLKPDRAVIGEIFRVGLPAIVLQCLQSLTTLVMQLVFGFIWTGETKDLLVGIYGIYYKLQYFVLMLGYGLTCAVIPIIAFNYGRNNRKRVGQTIRYGLIVGAAIAVLGTALFECMPDLLLRCFHASSDIVPTIGESELSLGVVIMRITAISFLFALTNIVLASVLQALGSGVPSMILALLRLLIVLMPASYIFGVLGGVRMLWWGALVAEAVALVYGALSALSVYKKRLCREEEKPAPHEKTEPEATSCP